MDVATYSLFAFILTVIVIELTPGPNMAWLAVLSADRGRRAGLAAVLGVATGLALLGLLAALGFAALVARSPWLFETLRYGGTLFLLWLALEGWRSTGESSPARMDGSLRRHFRDGLMINLLNPKAGLFYLIVLPDYISPDLPSLPQAVALTAISVGIATGIHLGIVALAARAAVWLSNSGRTRLFRRALAVLLALIAIWLFLDTRPA